MVGAEARRVYFCRVTGKTVWSHMVGDAP